MDLLLTRAERERFAAWLEHEADTYNGVIAQMEALRQELVVKHFKMKVAAYRIVAKDVRITEETTLEG